MRTSTAITACLLLLGCLANRSGHAESMPSFQHVRAQHRSSYAVLLDRNDKVLQMLRLNPHSQRLPWVALRDLSPAMQKALLISEDRRFFQHHGVDWRAFVGAAWENLVYDTHRGASTLTMQLAGLLDPKLTRAAGGRTYSQKWRQIEAADVLEKHWSKAQILEAYLNLVTFRADLAGINAASQALFDTRPALLDTAQAAILAALLRGPNARPAVVAARACGVVEHLRAPRPSCNSITRLAYSRLSPHPTVPQGRALAPDLAREYLDAPGERLTTSVNIRIQRLALNTLSRQMTLTPAIGAGAVVVIDNKTAEILAYADSNADSAGSIDPIPVLRPVGTLTQAFLYELAIEQDQLTAASVLDNGPLPISSPNPYAAYLNEATPPDWVSVRTALGQALYAPAWHALGLVTPRDFSDRLQALGLSVRDPDTPDQVQGDLLSLANAYQALANHGNYRAASLHIGGAGVNRAIMNADASAIVSNILTDPDAHGDHRITPIRGYAAYAVAQTGAEQWCVGSTGAATVAVWMGNIDQSHASASGNDAATAWRTVVNALNGGLYPAHTPKLPGDIVIENIHFDPPVEAPRQELFLPDTEPSQISPATPDPYPFIQ